MGVQNYLMLFSLDECLYKAIQHRNLCTKDQTIISVGDVEEELLTFIFFLNLHINQVNAVLDIIPA